jgi:hypothetical protein
MFHMESESYTITSIHFYTYYALHEDFDKISHLDCLWTTLSCEGGIFILNTAKKAIKIKWIQMLCENFS